MALNNEFKFMHPDNIYRNGLNFIELAEIYPEIRKHVFNDLSGRVRFDFKNHEALITLTKLLLAKDFSLNVEIPHDTLVPTLGLRLNYVLWIRDLMNLQKPRETPSGIDIGTGATCIYPLLGAEMYGWNFLATEINENSVKVARENVCNNNLQHLISVKQVKNSTYLVGAVLEEKSYDFCMCNPPFFEKDEDLCMEKKSRKLDRSLPKNALTGSLYEVVVDGGEEAFVTGIMCDSVKLREKIKIYTTMLGRKSSFVNLKKKLFRDFKPVQIAEAEFFQGQTHRWGLAWTFCPNTLLKNMVREKAAKPIVFEFPMGENFGSCVQKIEDMFSKLNFKFERKVVKLGQVYWGMKVAENTWSKNRLRRRQEARANAAAAEVIGSNKEEVIVPMKKMKLDVEPVFEGNLKVEMKENGHLKLTMFCVSGVKDYAQQILQFIKNKLQKAF